MEKSYFNVMPQSQCFPRCDTLLNHIKKTNIQKSSQWCILNRKHSNIMVYDDYTKLYKDIYAPDEICYITNIYVNNLQEEVITTNNVANEATTFTNWQGMDYKFPSNNGLKNYTFISEEEINHLLSSKCFFGRKFTRECIGCFSKLFYIKIINSVF